jgi:hypothetical protein
LKGWLDDELAVLNENVLVGQSCLFEFAISKGFRQIRAFKVRTKAPYPNPPTSASCVHTSVFNPPEKLSLNTGQYLWCTTVDRPSYTRKPAIPNPNNKPINGIIVTHFSFGSFFDLHGCSTSPFFTLLEWKYLWGSPRTADEEPNDEAGLELKGEAKGFGRGAGEISSPKGLLRLSGVPGRIGVVAVETAADMPLPL